MKRKSCYLALGENLRTIRKNVGLKQVDIAVATGLNRTYISRIETGQARVTFSVLHKLAEGLHTHFPISGSKTQIWTI